MPTIELMQALPTPLKSHHRMVIEGDYASYAGQVLDFDNRLGYNARQSKALILSTGEETKHSFQSVLGQPFMRDSEICKMRDFTYELDFSTTDLVSCDSPSAEDYQIHFRKDDMLSSWMKIGISAAAVHLSFRFDKVNAHVPLGQSEIIEFDRSINIPTQMMTANDRHRLQIRMSFGMQTMYNGGVKVSVNEGTHTVPIVVGTLEVSLDNVLYYSNGLVNIFGTEPTLPFEFITGISQYKNCGLLLREVIFSNKTASVESTFRIYGMRFILGGASEKLGSNNMDFREYDHTINRSMEPRRNLLNPMLTGGFGAVSVPYGIYYVHMAHAYSSGLLLQTQVKLQSVPTSGHGSSVEVVLASSGPAGAGMYVDCTDRTRTFTLTNYARTQEEGPGADFSKYKNLCLFQKVGTWAMFAEDGLTPFSWNSLDSRKMIFESTLGKPLTEGIGFGEQLVIPMSAPELGGGEFVYAAPALKVESVNIDGIIIIGGGPISNGRIKVYAGNRVVMTQAMAYDGVYRFIAVAVGAQNNIIVGLEGIVPDLDKLPRILLLTRKLPAYEEPNLVY